MKHTYGILLLTGALLLVSCAQPEGSMREKEDEAKMKHQIQITVADQTIKADLADNEAAAELLELLKEGDVTITLSEYGGFERVGELPRTLASNDRNMQAKPGDVMLYQSSSIVFFYGTNRWAYTKLATISDLRADEIKSFFDQDDTAVLSMP